MKNLILIIFLLPVFLQAQDGDKVDHFCGGYMAGATFNGAAYCIISEKTNIKPFMSKVISFGIGVAAGFGLGYLKENHDNKKTFFSRADLESTTKGALVGALSVTIFIGRSRHAKHVPKELIIN